MVPAMTTSPQVDGPTLVLDRAPAAVDVLDLAGPLPAMPLVDPLIYDLVVRARLCDPLIEAVHDVDLRSAALPIPPAALRIPEPTVIAAQLTLTAA